MLIIYYLSWGCCVVCFLWTTKTVFIIQMINNFLTFTFLEAEEWLGLKWIQTVGYISVIWLWRGSWNCGIHPLIHSFKMWNVEFLRFEEKQEVSPIRHKWSSFLTLTLSNLNLSKFIFCPFSEKYWLLLVWGRKVGKLQHIAETL